MTARPYEEIAARARAARGPEERGVGGRLGRQLDREVDDQEALGRELRAARLTQPELAELSAVQQAVISRIERGLGNPTRDTLLRLTAPSGMRLALVPAHDGPGGPSQQGGPTCPPRAVPWPRARDHL